MGDWEFLYDMKNEGYSEEDIMDAQGSGATPAEWAEIEKQEREEKEGGEETFKSLRDIAENSSE